MRVAAIDLGTNSFLLTIAEQRPNGDIVPLEEHATITRLGQDVERTKQLQPAAVTRSLTALRAYAERMAHHRVSRRAAVGTAALRDVDSGQAFLDQATAILATPVETISGQREATLCFAGVNQSLGLRETSALVFDVGGGSTEFIGAASQPAAEQLTAVSLNIGSVRLTERHLHTDPPTNAELAAINADIAAQLRTLPFAIDRFPRLIGVAGTVTTLATMLLELDVYDSERVNRTVLSRADLDTLVTRLRRLPLAERRNLIGLDPGRADVILAGALIVRQAVDHFGLGQIDVSDRGVRWGLIYQLLEDGSA